MAAFTPISAGQRVTAGYLRQIAGPATQYTPVVTNGGSATFSTLTGLWFQTGAGIFVNIDIVIGTAGSGSGIVTITMPTVVDRGQRQALTMHAESIGAGGNASSHISGGEAVFFPTSTGSTTDRLRIDEGGAVSRENNILGNDLLAGGHITIQGTYL